MKKVKIIVDSTADLTEELYKDNEIGIVPLNINFDLDSYKDGVDITAVELFKKVEDKGMLPKSSAPTPNDFYYEFKKWTDKGMDVIYMGIASTFSSAFQNACLAKEQLGNNVYLLDSKNLSTGIGLLALKACKLANEGLVAEEILKILEGTVDNVRVQFALDALDYLHKGGRCSGASQLFGHIFHIHPIIKVDNGKMIVSSKPRGPMKVAITEMVENFKKDLPNIEMDNVFVTHSGLDDNTLNYFVNSVKALVDENIVKISTAGCVISTHCGPRCCGILYIKK